MKKKSKTKIVTIGNIGVDAGLCWIGDPCYVLHKTGKDKPKAIGRDWEGFCDIISDMKGSKSFNFDLGHEGLGVCVSTGFGDGCYPVKAIVEDHGDMGVRVMGVFVDFGSSKAAFEKVIGRKVK